MITRWAEDEDEPKGPMATVTKIFENVGTAKVATSAQDARSLKFLRKFRNYSEGKCMLGRFPLPSKTRPLQGFVRGYEKGGLSGWSGIVSPIFIFSSVRPRWFVQKQHGLPRVRRGYSAQIRLNVSYRPHILYFVQCLVTHSLQILRSRE